MSADSIKMTDDKRVIFRYFDDNGWTTQEDGRGYIASHPHASTVVHFGGRHGWQIQRIRRKAEQALGRKVQRVDRKKAVKSAAARERQEVRAEWAQAAAAHRKRDSGGFYDWADRAVRRQWGVTEHCRKRIEQRGITPTDIEDALLNPVFVDIEDYHSDEYRGGASLPIWYGRRAVVVADVYKGVLVTVYRSADRPPVHNPLRRPRIAEAAS